MKYLKMIYPNKKVNIINTCLLYTSVADYKESYNRAANRLVREFSNSFCREDGSIDWEKLVEFNSGD